MTIKVTVTNSDSRETAIISVVQKGMTHVPFQTDTDNGPVQELKGGQSAEVWVHAHQYLIVKEVGQ